MAAVRNPAKSRPLSANVRRLMKMEREAPKNPNVMKAERPFTEMDIANCEMQGEIFMAAVDRGVDMSIFAPLFMNSQIASIIDYSFSRSGGAEADKITSMLNIPLLMKTPDVFVDVILWLNGIVEQLDNTAPLNLAVIEACIADNAENPPKEQPPTAQPKDLKSLADDYEYAYWLGYIYRCECLLHEESSRMVYGAFSEAFMRQMYSQMVKSNEGSDEAMENEPSLAECAGEICRRLDTLLIGNLWKDK